MSRLLLIVFSFFAAAAQGPRRIEYPAEKFSIAIPATWGEIEPAALNLMSLALPRVPNISDIKVRHGYTGSTAPPLFPWVAVLITDQPVDEAMFEKLDGPRRAYEEAIGVLQSSNGVVQQARLNGMSYDKTRHLLWNTTQSTVVSVGALRTLSGAYLTIGGTVQVHCYSREEDFARDQPVCREIIESVVLDPKVVLPARVETADYGGLVKLLEAGNLSVNFRTLRLACMKSPECEPRASKADLAEFNAASRANRYAKVVELGEKLLRRGFVNLEVRATLVAAYRALKDEPKAKFHLAVTQGLLRSILFSGDGKTKETAYEVISDREELSTLSARQLYHPGSESSTSQIEDGGHRYDCWEIWDPINKVVVYFNTDAFTAKSRAAD